MNYPINSEEKSTLLSWLHRFGSRFKTGFIVTDPANDKDEIVFVNDEFTQITGYSSDEVLGKNLQFLQGEDTDMDLIREIDQKLHIADPVNVELLNYKKDGTPFWNELVIQPIVNEKGEILLIVSFILDVTERKKNELLLKLQERIFRGIIEKLELDELLQKINGVLETFLPTGTATSFLFKEENDVWTIKAAESIPENILEEMNEELNQKDAFAKENIFLINEFEQNANQDFGASWSLPLFDNDRTLTGILIILVKGIVQPTDAQRQYLQDLLPVIQLTKTFFDQQERYRRLAYSDAETGLPNRHAFLKELKKVVDSGAAYFVAIVRPSQYDKIIDLFGRDAADDLFIQLARRIEKIGRGKANYVGKSSSSSLIITNELNGIENSKYYVLQLKKIVAEPFIVAGEEMFITLKTGISLSRNENYGAEEMIRRADVALSFAKRMSGGSLSFYKDLQSEETAQEMTIFNELTKALAVNEIDVYFQPKVDLETREIIGFEALARWYSPILGQVPPDLFIPIAENTGKIIELEIGVLTIVLEWQRNQMSLGNKMYQVAVNISVDHFFHASFFSMLKKLVTKHDVEPKYIRLEITESIGLVDFERAKIIFAELHLAGFEVSIDDFGVGFSSLSYLPQLQVSELKIDRSFIRAIDEPDTRAVIMTIIQLANNLNLSIVAEGIEEEAQIQTLLTLGCQIGQGFYFYKPAPLHEINQLLQEITK